MTQQPAPVWRARLLLTALIALTAMWAGSAPALAYTVYLKDGSRLIAIEQPVIEDGQAIITLQNGTRTSIAASEIDLEKTRGANKDDYGTAMVLEEGSFTDINHENVGAKRGRLSDVSNQPTVGSRPQARREVTVAPGDALENWQRVPYRGNLDLASEIIAVFRGQGIDQVGIYQGTTSRRLLLELSTNSESAVFRGLKIAAGALSRVRGLFPEDVEAFELVMSTAQRDRAGQFLITPEDASLLLDDESEVSSYFVRYVRF